MVAAWRLRSKPPLFSVFGGAALVLAVLASPCGALEDREAELEALHAEAQRRQLVVKDAPKIITFTALHPAGGQLQDSVYNNGVRMQSEFV